MATMSGPPVAGVSGASTLSAVGTRLRNAAGVPALPSPLAKSSPSQRHSQRAQVASSSSRRRACRAEQGASSSGSGSGGGADRIPDTLPSASADTDWREFRARLVAATSAPHQASAGHWAHPLPAPETGCILMAHPSQFTQFQTYFHQAVIYIFDHRASGSAGLIINKPTERTIGSLSGAEALCPEFSENRLFLGGDVGVTTVHVVHRVKGIKGSVEVMDGIYMGGFEAAKEAVRTGVAKASDFRWFSRYAGWGPGQLESECQRGVWVVAACDKGSVLEDDLKRSKDLWPEILQLMGGEYAAFAKKVDGL
eukprot:jgi/Chlat1/3962/Chrsp26S04207